MSHYPGGKNGDGVFQTIINELPPHRLYIEPFLGSGAIMRYKRPAEASVGIDLDPAALDLFEQLAPPTLAPIRRAKPRRNPAPPDAGLTLAQTDALCWLFLAERTLGPETLIYADPPYLPETRRDPRPLYAHELTPAEHETLLAFLTDLAKKGCMVALSGYASDLYDRALAHWPRRLTFQAQTRGGRTATEVLWCSYPEPEALHDYRFLGRDYRQRETIRKRIRRWTRRLARMPQLERGAILAALADVPGPSQSTPRKPGF